MCQTEYISHSIIRLSRRSYERRLDVSSPQVSAHKSALTSLNNKLDVLYDDLYEAFATATAADYAQFGYQLRLLLETLKGLLSSYRKEAFYTQLKERCERLRKNVVALEELDHDYRNFKVNILANPRYTEVISTTKQLMSQR